MVRNQKSPKLASKVRTALDQAHKEQSILFAEKSHNAEDIRQILNKLLKSLGEILEEDQSRESSLDEPETWKFARKMVRGNEKLAAKNGKDSRWDYAEEEVSRKFFEICRETIPPDNFRENQQEMETRLKKALKKTHDDHDEHGSSIRNQLSKTLYPWIRSVIKTNPDRWRDFGQEWADLREEK